MFWIFSSCEAADLERDKEREETKMTSLTEQSKSGQGVGFERIRRITGYLVGTMGKWNDAKKAEEHDRVRHSLEK